MKSLMQIKLEQTRAPNHTMQKYGTVRTAERTISHNSGSYRQTRYGKLYTSAGNLLSIQGLTSESTPYDVTDEV